MAFPNAAMPGLNYVPNAGFGGFSPVFHPSINVVVIKVRIHWAWEDVANQPVWTGVTRTQFLHNFKHNVPAAWNGKWRFRCTHPGYTQHVVDPRFVIEDGTPANHHFSATVRNIHGQSYLNAGNGSLVLHKTDNDEFDTIPGNAQVLGMSKQGILGSERQKIDAILGPVQNIQLDRTQNGWVVGAASQPALLTFAQELGRAGALAPHYPLTVHTSSGLSAKGQSMADCVAAFIAANGGQNYPVNTDAEKTRRKFRWPQGGDTKLRSRAIFV